MAQYRGVIIGAYVLFTSFYMLRSANQAIHQRFFPYAEYWHILFCILSILGIYCIAVKLCRSEFIGKLTQELSPTTFLVYLSHVLFIFILNNILNQYNFSPLHRYGIRIIIIYPVVFCFAYYFSVFTKHQIKENTTVKS